MRDIDRIEERISNLYKRKEKEFRTTIFPYQDEKKTAEAIGILEGIMEAKKVVDFLNKGG